MGDPFLCIGCDRWFEAEEELRTHDCPGRAESAPLLPLLQVIFDALKERGWTLASRAHAGYIDPEGNRHGSLEAAIAAQTFREIVTSGEGEKG